jgi:hypothetical protein
VHGTYWRAWERIRTLGLSRMTRNHIHFAQGVPGTAGVISGMRASAEVLVFLDVPAALAAGIPLFRSANGVLLSPGLGPAGTILPSFFARAVDARTGTEVWPPLAGSSGGDGIVPLLPATSATPACAETSASGLAATDAVGADKPSLHAGVACMDDGPPER